MINSCIEMIRSTQTIQAYASQKLCYALQAGHRQQSLLMLSLWCVGEYCEMLEETPQAISELFENLQSENLPNLCKLYFVNAIFKVGMKIADVKEAAIFILHQLSFDSDVEAQQRACEYLVLLRDYSENLRKVADSIPSIANT
mmetsp:Transcript_32123/g.31875  ORF Transcript_32123/g.31875 Transcript_32123/m.31875 type:complete len:143 (+) Transcript_32123:1248-1676(+)